MTKKVTSTPTICLPSPDLGSCTCVNACIIGGYFIEAHEDLTLTTRTYVADLKYYLHMIIQKIRGDFGYSIQCIFSLHQKENDRATS